MRNEKGQFIKGQPSAFKGRKHTLQSRKIIGEIQKGRKQSDEVKKNHSIGAKKSGCGKWMLGRKLAPETCKKLSLKRIGYKFSVESKNKMSEAQKGEKNWNWKGGITPLKIAIWHSFKYRQWRSDIFHRDNFTCVWCNQKGGKLNADHIKQFGLILKENHIKSLEEAISCEELWDINNGRTLCISCHKKTGTWGKHIQN